MSIAKTEREVQSTSEHRFLAASWPNPVELGRVCGALALREIDFGDRLVGITVGYVRSCADRGVTPDLDDCERVLTERAVPRSPGELYAILQEPVTPGDTLADLALAVQQSADRRTDELCRMLAREAFRAASHTFNCPRCIGCAQTESSQPRLRMVAPRARKAWREQYEPANG